MSEPAQQYIVDTFGLIGTYPFGAPGSYDVRELLDDMETLGITRTYVSSMDAFFANDLTAANHALLHACTEAADRLCPVPMLDLTLPGWPHQIKDWQKHHPVHGVRLAPNYHGYALTPELFVPLAETLIEHEMILFIAAALEDTRFQPRCLNVISLTLQNVLGLLKRAPELRVVLNGLTGQEVMALGPDTPGNVLFDVSCMDRPFGILEKTVGALGAERLVFGSLHPILIQGGALANLQGSDLPAHDIERILRGF